MANLVFIISLPRSGSTLLQRLLVRHPEVSSVSEPWLLLPLAYMTRQTGWVRAPYNHDLAQAAIRDLIEQMEKEGGEWLSCVRRFSDDVYASVGSRNARYFIDKTPRYFLIMPFIEKLYPDAKYIFLFRQPLAVMASIVTTWNNGRFLPYYQNDIDLSLGPRLIVEAWERLKSRSIRICYEDMVTNPEETLKTVMDYLGLEATNTVCSTSLDAVRFSGVMGDKSGLKKYKSVSPGSLKRWVEVFDSYPRRWYAKRYLADLGNKLIGSMGYDSDDILRELESAPARVRIGLTDAMDMARIGMFRMLSSHGAYKVARKILVPGCMFYKGSRN